MPMPTPFYPTSPKPRPQPVPIDILQEFLGSGLPSAVAPNHIQASTLEEGPQYANAGIQAAGMHSARTKEAQENLINDPHNERLQVLNKFLMGEEVADPYSDVSNELRDTKVQNAEDAATTQEDIYQRPGQQAMRGEELAGKIAIAHAQHPPTGKQMPEDYKIDQMADQLANYSIPLPAGTALREPEWQEAMRRATQKRPDWSAADYNNRQKLRQGFTSGKEAANIRSLNTAIGHLGSLQEAGKNLGNSSVGFVNQVGNWFANQTGDPRIKAYTIPQTGLKEELGNLFHGGPSEKAAESWATQMDVNGGDDIQAQIVKGIAELMGSRGIELTDQYNRAGYRPGETTPVLSDHAVEILKRLGAEKYFQRTGAAPGQTGPATATATPAGDGGGVQRKKIRGGGTASFINGQWVQD